jgi:hypothetical protein
MFIIQSALDRVSEVRMPISKQRRIAFIQQMISLATIALCVFPFAVEDTTSDGNYAKY